MATYMDAMEGKHNSGGECVKEDDEPTDEEIIATAKSMYPDIEFDGDATVSRGDESGAYVQGWVWVAFPDED